MEEKKKPKSTLIELKPYNNEKKKYQFTCMKAHIYNVYA